MASNTTIKEIVLNRSTAVALTIRLELSDLPYVQSSATRNSLINYLYKTLAETTEIEYKRNLTINVDDLRKYIPSSDESINILQKYSIYCK